VALPRERARRAPLRALRSARRALFFAGLTSAPAHALELDAGGEPVSFDVTLATSVIRAVDNRDFRLNQVPTLANDDYGVLFDRLNLQASRGALQLGMRLDHAWFYTSPDPTAIALELEEARRAAEGGPASPAFFRRKVDEAGVELSNRYINWLYPAKYYAAYTTRSLELSLGDAYAELGRGFVLSLRKQDELASDTTLRGVRATVRLASGPLKLRVTALGGGLNPLRIDEASGRYLGSDESVRPGFLALTEAGMPGAIETDFVTAGEDCLRTGTCSYAPDRLAAGQIEARGPGFVLATQASLLVRQPALSNDVVRTSRHTLTASQSLELLRIAGAGSLYVEGALQKLDHSGGATGVPNRELDPGHALYVSASVDARPLHLALEGKHYRRFFPLLANVSTARAREFALLAYSAPPTTEALENDTEFEGFNTCTTGGRLRADARASKRLELFGWLGHYRTWAESATNDACVIRRELENRVFDAALGADAETWDRDSHALLELGGRLDESAEPAPAPGESETSRLYYYEVRARYVLGVALGGPFHLDVEGLHRRRYQRVGGPEDPWFQGRQVVALTWAPRWSFAFGTEYDTSGLVPATYFNGEVTFRPSSDSSASLFAGQRAGALRCVGGVCRVFPPFEGARLDVTFRF
jgi:hypothetical protein